MTFCDERTIKIDMALVLYCGQSRLKTTESPVASLFIGSCA
jgi:hypothetical protein